MTGSLTGVALSPCSVRAGPGFWLPVTALLLLQRRLCITQAESGWQAQALPRSTGIDLFLRTGPQGFVMIRACGQLDRWRLPRRGARRRLAAEDPGHGLGWASPSLRHRVELA